MLEKYLKFLGGKEHPAPQITEMVPPASVPPGAGDRPPETEPETDAVRAAEMLRHFLGRQPVMDVTHQIVGYEFKLRDENLPSSPEKAERIHDEMLMVSVIDLDYQKALGNRLTIISLSPSSLFNPLIMELPREKTAVAFTLQPGADAKLLGRCQELVAQGVRLVLENFDYRPEFEPFLKICRYVSIDTRQFDALTLADRIVKIASVSSPVLVAKNIETEDAFEAYRKLSFDLFQGYYFARLQPNSPQRIDTSKLRVIELLNRVMQHAELSDLEEAVKLDPALSYKLISYINSPANGFPQKIRSIGHALTIMGYNSLYRWLTILLFASGKADARCRTLLKSALIRARLTETLGQGKLPAAEEGGLFIVGIFSLLDVLLNVPMEDALAKFSLPEPVVEALLRHGGIYGPYLELAVACEHFDQEAIARHAQTCGRTPDEVNLAHVRALIWAEEVDS